MCFLSLILLPFTNPKVKRRDFLGWALLKLMLQGLSRSWEKQVMSYKERGRTFPCILRFPAHFGKGHIRTLSKGLPYCQLTAPHKGG